MTLGFLLAKEKRRRTKFFENSSNSAGSGREVDCSDLSEFEDKGCKHEMNSEGLGAIPEDPSPHCG